MSIKAVTIQILFKAHDIVAQRDGADAALKFLTEALNQRDDTAAISFMIRNLG